MAVRVAAVSEPRLGPDRRARSEPATRVRAEARAWPEGPFEPATRAGAEARAGSEGPIPTARGDARGRRRGVGVTYRS